MGRVERKDFIDHLEKFDDKMSNETLFKDPVNHDARITAVKFKIYYATGIQPHLLDIIRVNISSKNATLAWITFASEKTVKEIFRLSVQNGNETKFNCFPHIPGKGMKRNDGIVKILKRLQLINTNLRYQIRLGANDLELYIKNYFKYDFRPYVRINIDQIDPNDTVPDWETCGSYRNPFSQNKQNDSLNKTENKRSAEESPEGSKMAKKRKNITDLQISEFLWCFLEGTETSPRYEEISWDAVETALGGEAPVDDIRVAPIPATSI